MESSAVKIISLERFTDAAHIKRIHSITNLVLLMGQFAPFVGLERLTGDRCIMTTDEFMTLLSMDGESISTQTERLQLCMALLIKEISLTCKKTAVYAYLVSRQLFRCLSWLT